MTLSNMLSELYRRLGYASSPATGVTTRLTAFLNLAQQELLADPGLGRYLVLDVPPLTFASVADQQVYALPTDRINSITDRTNDRKLEPKSLDWWRSVQPDPTQTTGTPEVWVPLGFSAVAKQPSDASKLYVDSSSASDTGTAYLEGIRTGGYPTSLSVLMTGTTAVTFSAAITDIVEVTKFYLSTAAVGTVTLQEDTGDTGDTLSTIPIGQSFGRFLRFALWPTPASAVTYYVDGERPLPDLSIATDQPIVPQAAHRFLIDYAEALEWNKKDDARYSAALARAEKTRRQLRYDITCPPDFLPSRAGQVVERSRLGGQYPGTDW